MTRFTRNLLRGALPVLALVVALTAQDWPALARATGFATAEAQSSRLATISEADMQAWLTYLASDALQGRDAFSEGYGLAASFVAENLKAWGVKPLGDNGTYFQEVKRRSYRVTRNSSVTVEAGGQSRTFKHGDHVTFPANAGGKQTLTFGAVEFVGYGQVNLAAKHDDFRGRDLKGKLVVGLSGTPKALLAPQVDAAPGGGRGGRGANFAGRGNYIVQTLGAGGVVSLQAAPPPPSAEEVAALEALDKANQAVAEAQTRLQQARAAAGRGGRGGGGGAGRGAGGRGAAAPAADLTGVQNVNALIAPQFTGDEAFFDFLFSTSPVKLADLRAKAAAPAFSPA